MSLASSYVRLIYATENIQVKSNILIAEESIVMCP